MNIDPETPDSTVKDVIGVPRSAKIQKRPGMINGDPEDLIEIDWSAYWNPDDNA
jgi:hypothetical protein